MESPTRQSQRSESTAVLSRLDPERILKIRLLVLALGQKDFCDWWSCSFLTPAGERFLGSPFPRSAFWAAFHASSVAAGRHHDERIGTGGTVHLFRLGQEVEIQLRNKVLRDGWQPGFELNTSRDTMLNALRENAKIPEQTPSAGPLRVSDRQRFTGPKMLEQVAGVYAVAFETGTQILPYGVDK